MKSRVHLTLAWIMLILGFTAPIMGQSSFTEADLEGTWAIATKSSGPLTYTGVLVLDGTGGLSGVRDLLIGASPPAGPFLHQTITGTYTVNLDGTGSASVSLSPPDPGGRANEEIALVISGADEFHLSSFSDRHGTSSSAEAIRQQSADEADDVEIRLEALELLSCEMVRLLLTPQGQRASDCCDALMDFPDGKDAPSCGGTVVTSPSPVFPPAPGLAPPRQR